MNAASLGTPTLETIHQGLLRDYYAQLGEKNYEQQTSTRCSEQFCVCLPRAWRRSTPISKTFVWRFSTN